MRRKDLRIFEINFNAKTLVPGVKLIKKNFSLYVKYKQTTAELFIPDNHITKHKTFTILVTSLYEISIQ